MDPADPKRPRRFADTILKQKDVNHFSWAYLFQCLLSLLEALHLYTPERKKILNKITESVKKEPQISELAKRFGLFSAAHPPPVVPTNTPIVQTQLTS